MDTTPISEAAASAASAPPDIRALGRVLIDAFGKGWAKGDVPLLMSVFTDDAVFIETPFSAPRTGRDAILQYWRDVPVHQAELTFSSGEIFVVGPWFSVEYKVTFRRRRTGEWVEARGAMFCETAGDKISELRMYWHRWAGGREA
ncbi:MAG: nuclear transport factor 2 family protein [Gemmatimonadales bacterium]|jgi:ketosteroid isomerase-like protein|nr:MAG: nuclear transport factor 2 family protein [Gemmatimonadales bacterium]